MNTEKPKREPPISYRPPKHLRAEFDERVRLSGLSANAFLTEAWHGKSRHRPAEQKFLARMLGSLAEIRDLLREAVQGGSGEHSIVFKEIRDELIKIRSLLMKALGRRS